MNKNECINIEGEAGLSLFRRPILTCVDQETIKPIQEKLDNYLKKYEDTSDERALAIIGSLSIENELDIFLSKWIKDYKNLTQANELTFSLKINLASSLKLIPQRILNAIYPIRKIRNVFAHNLDVETFSKAKIIDKKSFDSLENKINTFISREETTDLKTFKDLVSMIILSLNIYTKHIEKVNDFVWRPGNLGAMIKPYNFGAEIETGIQTFFLCKSINEVSNGFDINLICLNSFYSIDGKYPLKIEIPYFMKLQRQHRRNEEEVNIRINLFDSDGKNIFRQGDLNVVKKFPKGHRFFQLIGKIKLEFPAIGEYRLKLIVNENDSPSIYQYCIEIIKNPNS